MRALVYHGPGDIRCGSVADPDPGDVNGAVIQVAAAGICGSDLHIYEGRGFKPSAGYTVGHEAVGEVVEIGSGVRRFRSGDRVLVSAGAGCGVCVGCQAGRLRDCEIGAAIFGIGLGLGGAQAEALAVPGADMNLMAIDETISDDQALLLTDNLPTGWFGAGRADIEPGAVVAVVGLGPVGQMAVDSAFVLGASHVLAIDTVVERLAAAEAVGAEPIVSDEHTKERVLDRTNGRGADAVVEAVGRDETIRLALDIVRVGGTVSAVGVPFSEEFSYPLLTAFGRNVTFRIGLADIHGAWPALVPLVRSGRIRPERVVTTHTGLSDGADAYARYLAREDGVMKVTLDPSR
jgi:2-desacetyl-2-hydroxyethyl bacteriochlorophyllide A dehydrogenase